MYCFSDGLTPVASKKQAIAIIVYAEVSNPATKLSPNNFLFWFIQFIPQKYKKLAKNLLLRYL
jgi:hypothetical protein